MHACGAIYMQLWEHRTFMCIIRLWYPFCKCIYIYIHTYYGIHFESVYTYTYIHTYPTRVYKYTHACTLTQWPSSCLKSISSRHLTSHGGPMPCQLNSSLFNRISLYVCMHACMYVCTFKLHMNNCIHTQSRARLQLTSWSCIHNQTYMLYHVCMYVCIYAYVISMHI